VAADGRGVLIIVQMGPSVLSLRSPIISSLAVRERVEDGLEICAVDKEDKSMACGAP
jgi:hypothetical protein